MATTRRPWFVYFLIAILALCVVAQIVPSWKKEITGIITVAFVGLTAWGLFSQLDRVEGKLDAILKKLNEH